MSAEGTKDIERRVGLLENKDRYNDKRFRTIENSMKQDRKEINVSIKELHDSLKLIEKGQHSQEITNVNINHMLEAINKDREAEIENKKESKRDLKQIKFIVLTAAVGFGFSFVMALIQQFFF